MKQTTKRDAEEIKSQKESGFYVSDKKGQRPKETSSSVKRSIDKRVSIAC
jgi:hypothetical protein